jgi:cell division protein FtsI (penicillin-binding protein 3)
LDARADSLTTKRLRILARLSFGWGLLIVGRLFWLQVLHHDELKRLALQQQDREVEIQAPRGVILDRTGQHLAMSLPVDSVCVNPMRIADLPFAAGIMARTLDVDEPELLDRLKAAVKARRGFLWVKRKITPEESQKVRSLGFDWIEFRTESRRFYPKGALAAHLLGGVDHAEKGNGGIEQSLNKELEGRPGLIRTTSDVKQRVVDQLTYSDPQPGKTVQLTIDERIQYTAEKELAAAVRGNRCTTGSIVVMNPHTGEIYAMAAYPSFNPNDPVKPGQKLEERANLPVISPFEPGSVFKVITLTAALETTRLRPETIIPCGNGQMVLFKRVIHDHNSYASLPMRDVLAKSSNIGAINVGLTVGEEKLKQFVRLFGFGRSTGLPLPGESPGLLRKKWHPASIGSVAMGHEVLTTTVQLGQACSVIANGGMLVKPRLIVKRQRPGQSPDVPEKIAPPVRIIRPETAVTMGQMMKHVIEPGGTGTAARLKGYSSAGKTGSAQIYDYAARVYRHGYYNASFMGFAPVANPAIVVVVTLNGATKYGGTVAAPVFNKVATAALRILDVPKDLPDDIIAPEDLNPSDMDDTAIAELSDPDPDEDTVLASAAAPAPAAVVPGAPPALLAPPAPPLTTAPPTVVQQAVALGPQTIAFGPKVPNFRGKTLRAVMQESAANGLSVEFIGSGIARAQEPAAGTVLRQGDIVRVEFAR